MYNKNNADQRRPETRERVKRHVYGMVICGKEIEGERRKRWGGSAREREREMVRNKQQVGLNFERLTGEESLWLVGGYGFYIGGIIYNDR